MNDLNYWLFQIGKQNKIEKKHKPNISFQIHHTRREIAPW